MSDIKNYINKYITNKGLNPQDFDMDMLTKSYNMVNINQFHKDMDEFVSSKPPKGSIPNISGNLDNKYLNNYIGFLESNNNYKAVGPQSTKSRPWGKYQHMWGIHGSDISKITGVKSETDYLNNPQAQEKYQSHLTKQYIGELPNLRRLANEGGYNFSDEELIYLNHHHGSGGARQYLKGIYGSNPEAQYKQDREFEKAIERARKQGYGGNKLWVDNQKNIIKSLEQESDEIAKEQFSRKKLAKSFDPWYKKLGGLFTSDEKELEIEKVNAKKELLLTPEYAPLVKDRKDYNTLLYGSDDYKSEYFNKGAELVQNELEEDIANDGGIFDGVFGIDAKKDEKGRPIVNIAAPKAKIGPSLSSTVLNIAGAALGFSGEKNYIPLEEVMKLKEHPANTPETSRYDRMINNEHLLKIQNKIAKSDILKKENLNKKHHNYIDYLDSGIKKVEESLIQKYPGIDKPETADPALLEAAMQDPEFGNYQELINRKNQGIESYKEESLNFKLADVYESNFEKIQKDLDNDFKNNDVRVHQDLLRKVFPQALSNVADMPRGLVNLGAEGINSLFGTDYRKANILGGAYDLKGLSPGNADTIFKLKNKLDNDIYTIYDDNGQIESFEDGNGFLITRDKNSEKFIELSKKEKLVNPNGDSSLFENVNGTAALYGGLTSILEFLPQMIGGTGVARGIGAAGSLLSNSGKFIRTANVLSKMGRSKTVASLAGVYGTYAAKTMEGVIKEGDIDSSFDVFLATNAKLLQEGLIERVSEGIVPVMTKGLLKEQASKLTKGELNALTNILEKKGFNKFLNTVGKKIVNQAKATGSESIEEVVAAITEPYLNTALNSLLDTSFNEEFSMSEIINAAALGAIGGTVISAPSTFLENNKSTGIRNAIYTGVKNNESLIQTIQELQQQQIQNIESQNLPEAEKQQKINELNEKVNTYTTIFNEANKNSSKILAPNAKGDIFSEDFQQYYIHNQFQLASLNHKLDNIDTSIETKEIKDLKTKANIYENVIKNLDYLHSSGIEATVNAYDLATKKSRFGKPIMNDQEFLNYQDDIQKEFTKAVDKYVDSKYTDSLKEKLISSELNLNLKKNKSKYDENYKEDLKKQEEEHKLQEQLAKEAQLKKEQLEKEQKEKERLLNIHNSIFEGKTKEEIIEEFELSDNEFESINENLIVESNKIVSEAYDDLVTKASMYLSDNLIEGLDPENIWSKTINKLTKTVEALPISKEAKTSLLEDLNTTLYKDFDIANKFEAYNNEVSRQDFVGKIAKNEVQRINTPIGDFFLDGDEYKDSNGQKLHENYEQYINGFINGQEDSSLIPNYEQLVQETQLKQQKETESLLETVDGTPFVETETTASDWDTSEDISQEPPVGKSPTANSGGEETPAVSLDTEPDIEAKKAEIEKKHTFTNADLKSISQGTALAAKGAKIISTKKIESNLSIGDKITFFAERERKGTWNGKYVVEEGTKNPWGLIGILDTTGWLRNETKYNAELKALEQQANEQKQQETKTQQEETPAVSPIDNPFEDLIDVEVTEPVETEGDYEEEEVEEKLDFKNRLTTALTENWIDPETEDQIELDEATLYKYAGNYRSHNPQLSEEEALRVVEQHLHNKKLNNKAKRNWILNISKNNPDLQTNEQFSNYLRSLETSIEIDTQEAMMFLNKNQVDIIDGTVVAKSNFNIGHLPVKIIIYDGQNQYVTYMHNSSYYTSVSKYKGEDILSSVNVNLKIDQLELDSHNAIKKTNYTVEELINKIIKGEYVPEDIIDIPNKYVVKSFKGKLFKMLTPSDYAAINEYIKEELYNAYRTDTLDLYKIKLDNLSDGIYKKDRFMPVSKIPKGQRVIKPNPENKNDLFISIKLPNLSNKKIPIRANLISNVEKEFVYNLLNGLVNNKNNYNGISNKSLLKLFLPHWAVKIEDKNDNNIVSIKFNDKHHILNSENLSSTLEKYFQKNPYINIFSDKLLDPSIPKTTFKGKNGELILDYENYNDFLVDRTTALIGKVTPDQFNLVFTPIQIEEQSLNKIDGIEDFNMQFSTSENIRIVSEEIVEEDLNWLSNVLPQINAVEGLPNNITSNVETLGAFVSSLEILDDFGSTYGIYYTNKTKTESKRSQIRHEAFEAVWGLYVRPEIKEAVLNEAKRFYKKPTEKDLDLIRKTYPNLVTEQDIIDKYYKEQLADNFNEYESIPEPKSIIFKFFNWLKDLIKNTLSNRGAIDRLFNDIERGKFANLNPIYDNSVQEYSSIIKGLNPNRKIKIGKSLASFIIADRSRSTGAYTYIDFNKISSKNLSEAITITPEKLANTYRNISKMYKEADPVVIEAVVEDLLNKGDIYKVVLEEASKIYSTSIVDDEDYQDEENSTTGDEKGMVYNQASWGKSPKQNEYPIIKALMSGIALKDKSNNPIFNRDTYLPVVIPKPIVSNTLLRFFAGKNLDLSNNEAYLDELKKLIKYRKDFETLYNSLVRLNNDPNTKYIVRQFISSTYHEKNNFYNLYDTGKQRVLQNLSRSSEQAVIDNWNRILTERYKNDNRQEYLTGIVEAFKKYRNGYDLPRITFSLNLLGIEISSQALQYMYEELGVDHISFMDSIIFLLQNPKGLIEFNKNPNNFKNDQGKIEFKTDVSNLKNLAKAQSFFEDNLHESMISVAGEKMWIYSLPSYMSRQINNLKDKNELTKLKNKVYHRRSVLLDAMEKNNFVPELIDVNQLSLREEDDNGNITGIKTLENTNNTKKINDIVTSIFAHNNGKRGMAVGRLLSFNSHSRNNVFITLPKFYEAKEDGNINPEVTDIFMGYLLDELERIKYYQNNPSKYKNIDKNWKNNYLFPELSLETEGEVNPALKELRRVIFENDIFDTNGNLKPLTVRINNKEYSLKTALELFVNRNLNKILEEDKAIVTDLLRGSKVPMNNTLIENNTINGIIGAVEHTKLFLGDPSQYKDIIDVTKRTHSTTSSGITLDMPFKTNYVLLEGVEEPSDLYNDEYLRSELLDARYQELVEHIKNGNIQVPDDFKEKPATNIDYNKAVEEANTKKPIAQNFFDGYRPNSDVSKVHTIRPEITSKYGKGVKTITLVKDGIRTRTTRLTNWMKENNPKMGDYFWQINEKNPEDKVLTRITAVYGKSDPRFKDNWYKEGWIDSNFKYVENYDSAIEFEVVTPTTQPSTQPVEIKQGVEDLFNEYPELASIGTPEQYSQYLDTIFPDSKVKDIVYHNTDEQFDIFKIPFYAEDMYGQDAPIGVFFSTDKEYTKSYGNRAIVSIINLKNPKFEKDIEYEKVAGYRLGKKELEFDGLYGNDKIDLRDSQPSKGIEYVVFEPEQIHILGSKQDIEGFKKFASTTKTAPTTSIPVTREEQYARELAEKDIKNISYSNVDKTDAAAYVTLPYWKEILSSMGRWNPVIHDPIYEKLLKGEGSNKDILKVLTTLQPMKTVGYWLDTDTSDDVAISSYFKWSLLPLHPALFAENSNLKELYEKAIYDEQGNLLPIEKQVHIFNYTSTMKSTHDKAKVLKKGDNVMDKVNTIDSRAFKMQQDLSSKSDKKDQVDEPVQTRKNIRQGLLYNSLYPGIEGSESKTGKQIEQELSNIDRELVLRKYKKILSELDYTNGIIRKKDVISKFLLEEFKDKDIPDDLYNYLNSNTLDINVIPQYVKLIQNKFSSIFRKLNKQKLGGSAFIQTTEIGLTNITKSDIANASTDVKDLGNKLILLDSVEQENGIIKLKAPSFKEGIYKPSLVFLPHSLLRKLPEDQLTSEGVKNFFRQNPKLLKGIGSRIPNQGGPSIDSLEIAGVLPNYMGDTVVTYEDITRKYGSDYDVDKLYVSMYNWKFNSKGEPEVLEYYENPTEEQLQKLYNEKINTLLNNTEYKTQINEIYSYIKQLNESIQNDNLNLDKKNRELFKLEFDSIVNIINNNPIDNDAIEELESLINNYQLSKNIKLNEIKILINDINTLKNIVRSDYPYSKFLELSTYDKHSEKRLQNRKLDLYRQILESPYYHYQNITPLDNIKDDIRGTIHDYAGKDPVNYRKGLAFFSPVEQNTIKATNMEAKASLGLAANAASDFPNARSKNLKYNIPIRNGVDYSKIMMEVDGKYNLISDVIGGGYLSTFVDAEKDPFIRFANINKFTYPIVNMLEKIGFNFKETIPFVMHPIIADVLYFQEKESSIFSSQYTAIERAALKYFDQYKEENKTLNMEVDTYLNKVLYKSKPNLDVSLIEESYKNKSIIREYFNSGKNIDTATNSLNILYLFNQLKNHAKNDSLSVVTTKQDVNGAGATFDEAFVNYERIRKVLNISISEMSTFVDAIKTNTVTTEMLDFINSKSIIDNFVYRIVEPIPEGDYHPLTAEGMYMLATTFTLQDFMNEESIRESKKARSIIYDIFNNIGKTFVEDTELIKLIKDDIYRFSLTRSLIDYGYNLYGEDKKLGKVSNYVIGPNTIVQALFNENHPQHEILNKLLPTFKKQIKYNSLNPDEIQLLETDNFKTLDTSVINIIHNEINSLYEYDITSGNNFLEQILIPELINSGFTFTNKSILNFIPTSFTNKLANKENMFKVLEKDNGEFLNQFFYKNSENPKVVNYIPTKGVENYYKSYIKLNGKLALLIDDSPEKMLLKERYRIPEKNEPLSLQTGRIFGFKLNLNIPIQSPSITKDFVKPIDKIHHPAVNSAYINPKPVVENNIEYENQEIEVNEEDNVEVATVDKKIGFDLSPLLNDPEISELTKNYIKGKDAKKAAIATDIIEYGRDLPNRKSTSIKYGAEAVKQGIPRNSGLYDENTVAMVTVSGNKAATQEDIDNTVNEIIKVLDAGGSFVMDNKDNRNSEWNKDGEGIVFTTVFNKIGGSNLENISKDPDYVQVKMRDLPKMDNNNINRC